MCLMCAGSLITGCAEVRLTTDIKNKIDKQRAEERILPALIQPPQLQLTKENSGYRHPEEAGGLPVITRRTDQTAKAVESSGDCRLKDRFDRDATLAYNFSDHQSRLALHLDLDGPNLGNPTRLEVEEVMLRFTHRFKANRFKTDRPRKSFCLYDSHFQGIVGSVYNEIYMRDGKNAFDEAVDKLEEHGLDFWR